MENNSTNVNERVEKKLSNLGEGQKDEILSSFGHFKSYLSDKVSIGEKMGLDEEQLAKAAEKTANYLAKHEEPRNSEEKLLQELWKVGTQEEQHKLAHLLVKLVGK
ncbi:DUF3243 domain-containing protein [Bacillus massilinigeriensis]|uniref:DUF3243 domain-containing protein n=1 Tax=Bacillus mediterraneensis TaxID=1805474 RepID=UPI0008F8401D|nr:DUF3243 domain-containing protein [Bacillus mediterraneensis]